MRTARRWNAERGLPVHRVPGGKGASVFAYTDELEAWLNNSPATGQPDEGMPAPPEHDREAPSGRFSTEPADLSEPGKRPEFSPAARSPGSPYARLLILLVVAMSLAGGSYIIGGRLPIHNEAMPAPKRVMIAVLPFLNLSGETQQEYLADGMTEEMITALGGLNPEELGVIARTSVMTFKGSARPVREIGKNLGVDYVLEGSVTREGKRVRVIAQLIRVSDQTHLWAGNYDSDSPDILASENQVAGAIAAQIRINLQPNARIRSAGSGTVNPVAHEDYLMGRFYWNQRNAPAYEQARKYFTAALEKDPGYAAAYAGLADSYFGGPQAEGFARKAIELDDSVAEAHASLGYLKLTNDWDARGAEAEYRRALELDPNYVTAHHWYALLLAQTGRPDRAIAEIEMARELDPLSVVINTDSGMILYWARRYDPAVAQLQRALELDPHFDWAHFWLGRAYEQQGKYDKAIQNFQAARD
ncbi:MAG TPA: FlgO family outer membrane protein, partial [Terriglobia bacterium]|nr:FlgO family outer membrane protein [Terriglobia bacterium]